eukprot:440225-Hanusia_phi.AAC.1
MVVEDINQRNQPANFRQPLHAQHRDVVDDHGVKRARKSKEVCSSCWKGAEFRELERSNPSCRQLDLDLPALRHQRHRPQRMSVRELGEPSVKVDFCLPDLLLPLLRHDVGLEGGGHQEPEVDVGVHVKDAAALLDGGNAGEEQIPLDPVAVEIVRRPVREQ